MIDNACVKLGTNECVNDFVNCSDINTGKERVSKSGVNAFTRDGIVFSKNGLISEYMESNCLFRHGFLWS